MKTLSLFKFELYLVARELSRLAWSIYSHLPKQFQYNIGNQFIDAADSVQANIAEGQGRFHFKDKMKFDFNARGSLYETMSWSDILRERDLITGAELEKISSLCIRLTFLLNGHIRFLSDQSKKGTT